MGRAEGVVPAGAPVIRIVAGGRERFDSVWIGLGELPDGAEIVLVHDGVRPFVTVREVEDTVAMARQIGAGVAVSAPVETVKRIEGERLHATLDRERIRLAQTPQAFRVEILRRAYDAALEDGFRGTDEASLVERIGGEIGLVEADRWNLKITGEEDLRLAEWILREVRR
jgi:2-C-methyl-D-erythritol 4-phosphate cytidylyltransferase